MAVVARGARLARPATAPKHRKTSAPGQPDAPDTPDSPGQQDAAAEAEAPARADATRQPTTPAWPDATLELPAVDKPDPVGRRTDTRDKLTFPDRPDPLDRPTAADPPDAYDWFIPRAKPDTPGRPTLDPPARPDPARRDQLTAPARPDAAPGRLKPGPLSKGAAPGELEAPGRPTGPGRQAAPGRPAADRSGAARRPSAANQPAASHRRSAAREEQTAPNPVLPIPPKDHEKYTYVRRYMWVLTICSALSFPPLVYSQYRMVENSPWFLLYAPFALFGIMTFLLSLVVDGMSRSFDLAEHKRIVAGWLPLWYPSVDVFLPVCGEPIEVLRNAWNHVAVLRNRYPGQVTPYVLDDSANPELKAMARRFGFAYATRPDRGWFKKSGNLRYGFTISNGDYILLLDADFAPRADLLDETIPHLDMFPDIGIVQTPQFFRVLDEQTWVERGAGAIQELFYRSIQTARAKKDGAICVGSCAVYRRAALEKNNGMSLAEHSEDLHTGFDLYRLGYKLRYLPIALSTGNCPDNVLAFLNQQYRWCSGTMSLMRDKKFWRTKLPLYMRLCYLTGLVGYVYTAVFTFVAPALAITMLMFVPGQLLMRNLIFIAPVLFYAGVIYPMWHRAPYRLEAWSVRVISGWAHLFAFTDMLRGRLRGWQPSGSGSRKQDGRRRLWVGLICWSTISAVLWVGLALWRMMTMDPYNFFLIFVLGLFQLVVVGRILIQPRAGTT
jgi:cellulose synthase (UDP-forming)